jgi:uncharacterized protein YecT (DUF1311 family)
MRFLAGILFVATALAQKPHKSEDAYRADAKAILADEQARNKKTACNDPHSTQLDLNVCFAQEAQRIDARYTKFVRALGAVLRSDIDPPARPGPLPFDIAEDAWHDYRRKFCDAIGHQYEGGSMQPMQISGCIAALTFNHMKELGDLYSEDLTDR